MYRHKYKYIEIYKSWPWFYFSPEMDITRTMQWMRQHAATSGDCGAADTAAETLNASCALADLMATFNTHS